MGGSYEIVRGNVVVGAFVHVERRREPAPVPMRSRRRLLARSR